jgi:prolipoprotein diacylglyceryl transferase
VIVPASLPSPTQGVWQLGPLPVRAYALCILLGIVVAISLGDKRWRARGGRPGTIGDVAAWAVPFGIVGGRLYHVATSWQPYFGPGGHPIEALYIWQGGLGIWGAVMLGGIGAYIAARRAGVLMPPLADALAPGIVLAQAIGRWGNWFNNELYGGPTKLPWGLQIHQWDPAAGHAVRGPDGKPIVLGTFHPTFLYESLWDAGTAAVLIWVDRRFRIGHGRVFALYVLLYTLGRFWIEALRIDPANQILGLRLNLWTSVLVGLGALVYLVVSARLHPGREDRVVRPSAVVVPHVSVSERLGTSGTEDDTASTSQTASSSETASPTTSGSPSGEEAEADDRTAQKAPDDAATSKGVPEPRRAPRLVFWRRRPSSRPEPAADRANGEDLEPAPSRPDN